MWTSLRQLDELLSLCSHKAKAGRYHLLSPKWPLSEPISLKTTLFLPKDYLGKLLWFEQLCSETIWYTKSLYYNHYQGFIQDFSVGGGGNFFFIFGETMWLIDHREGEGVGG